VGSTFTWLQGLRYCSMESSQWTALCQAEALTGGSLCRAGVKSVCMFAQVLEREIFPLVQGFKDNLM